jgi:hypothetical protein
MTFENYIDVRKEIKTADIFFTASDAFFSKLIRIVTKGKVSHVGMFLVIEGRVFAVECLEGKGCRMSLASVRFANTKILVKHTNKTTQEKRKIIKNILCDVGRIEYDLWGAIIAPFFKTNNSKNFCSEWVVKILGLQLPVKRGVYPSDLL